MIISKLSCSLGAVFLASIIYASPVLADKGGNGNGHGKGHSRQDKNNGSDDDGNDVHVLISTSDRVALRRYIADDYHSQCPPGLAKKHNGCMPPGQAKKRYIIGRPLPDMVVWEPVPQPVLVQLQPIPMGYQYVRVDRDVLLISEASHKVIDAITLLSAVGN